LVIPDSTQFLPEVLVTGVQRQTNCGIYGVATETNEEKATPLVSVSELLNRSSFISLKNHAPGSLTTISLRGHSASQTNITLDDFSIQSNMNGVYDLSLIPSYFLEYISPDGSKSSADINGSIGGTLEIDTNKPEYLKNKLNLEYASSFGSYNDVGNYFSASGKYGQNDKNYSSFKSFYRSSKNNFPHRDLNQIGTPIIQLKNAAFQQYGFQQNNTFELKDSSFISTKFWYVNNHRGIPPTLTQNENTAFQDDELLNGIISWKKDWNKKINTTFSARYMNEHIYYNSPVVTTDSRAKKYEVRGKFNYLFNDKNNLSSTGGYEHSLAEVDDYEANIPKENRTYLNLSYLFDNDFFEFTATTKGEIVNGQLLPFTMDVRGKYEYEQNDNHFNINTSFSKNYRRPTFNDLYWGNVGGAIGNPNLSSEKGWKEELGFQYYNNSNKYISTGLTLFNSNINNWILWAANDDGVWTPENVKEVWSRGLEIAFQSNITINKNTSKEIKIYFFTRYNFTKTTNTSINIGSQNSLKKQLLYVPIHAGSTSIEFQFKDFSFTYNQMINGKRYTTRDNSDFVPSYSVSNIQLSYLFKKKRIEIEPVFEIRNIFNNEYVIVENRPLPPIHFQCTIYFRFKK
jgi:vitamin B12 transporter